uniref:hypothetical protein n=1 Tax=Vibrio harveyi TaxID=669 RepID=UPI0012D7106C|nr:hypothetical protein [Vibrio harveyi]
MPANLNRCNIRRIVHVSAIKMIDIDNEIDTSNDDFFTANLPEPSIQNAHSAVQNYQDALDASFVTLNSSSRFLLYSEHLDVIENEELIPFNDLISMSNYELSALSGEHVILFNEPMMVADISLNYLRASESAKFIRLISFNASEKKVTSKIAPQNYADSIKYKQQAKQITTFEVYDYVAGLILPRSCEFDSIRALSMREIIKDHEHIVAIQDAYQRLKSSGTEVTLAWQSTINKARELIGEGATRFEAAKNELQLLNQQKTNVESRIDSLQENIDSATKLNSEIQQAINSGNIRLQSLEERSKQLSEQYDQTKVEHDSISESLREDKEELATIRQELSEARKQKSLSNYESIAHTNEAKTQLLGYYLITGAVLIALCSFVTYIYYNAKSFEELLSRLVLLNASPWDILLSRLPLVTSTALVIGALSAVLFFLIKQIVSLNNEKMTMLKAGILAQQISDSLEIESKSDTEIIQIKRDIKIKLITEVFDKNNVSAIKGNYVKDLTELIKSCNGN